MNGEPVPDQSSRQLAQRLAADPFAHGLGVSLTDVRPGYARATLTVQPRHTNALGALHGGVVIALADVVHAAASNSHGTIAIAVEVHSELLATAPVGAELVCEGTELSRTRRTAVYRLEVHAGEVHVATCLGRVVRRDEPFPA
ncbi:MAG: hotdog fold thioesterase [Geodermatophilaceae bacterium]|nr:hotdog fold thioesterase [Geodermatophilaceae bacterium]